MATNYFLSKYGDPTAPAVSAHEPLTPTNTTPTVPVTKDSTLEHTAELGGAIALGAAGAALIGKRYPVVGDALERLTNWISDHPVIGAGTIGGIAGGAAATPHAVATDHPGEILAGIGLGVPAGVLSRFSGPLAARLTALGSDPASRLIARTALEDEGNASAASTRLRTLAENMRAGARGPVPNQETIADVLGPRGQATAQAALAQPDLKSQAFAKQLQQRQAGTAERVTDMINQGLAPSTPFGDEQKRLLTALKTNAKPLYDQAYQQFPEIQSQELYSILKTKPGKAAAKKAAQLMQMDGQLVGKPDVLGMVKKPSLQFLDYVKRALDDQVSGARRSGNNNEARLLGGMRDRLVNELDTATTLPIGGSPYQAARQQYQSDAEVLDALNDGLKEFPKLTPEQVRAKVGAMSFAAKDAYRSGVAEHLFRQIGNTGGGNPALAVIGTSNLRDKVAALFDDPKKAQAFIGNLQREGEMFSRTRGLLNQGARGVRMAVQPGPGIGSTIAKAAMHSINPKLAALRSMVDALGQRTIPGGPVSDIMRLSGRPAADKLMELEALSRRLNTGRVIGRNVGAAGATLGGVGAGMLPAVSANPNGMQQ
jgi:hypothetical protein